MKLPSAFTNNDINVIIETPKGCGNRIERSFIAQIIMCMDSSINEIKVPKSIMSRCGLWNFVVRFWFHGMNKIRKFNGLESRIPNSTLKQ